eukprot:3045218-Rhodomonas_salina.1
MCEREEEIECERHVGVCSHTGCAAACVRISVQHPPHVHVSQYKKCVSQHPCAYLTCKRVWTSSKRADFQGGAAFGSRP